MKANYMIALTNNDTGKQSIVELFREDQFPPIAYMTIT